MIRTQKKLSAILGKDEKQYLYTLEKRQKELKQTFNLFSFFEDLIDENAWTKIFSYLLDTNKDVNSKSNFLFKWLDHISKECNISLPDFERIKKLQIKKTQTVVEWSTQKRRRLDLLIRLLYGTNTLVGIIGLENKLDSNEQNEQLADYQEALSSSFPQIPKILFYCTPDRRKSKTSKQLNDCAVIEISYETILSSINGLSKVSSEQQKILFESLSVYLEILVNSYKINNIRKRITSQLGNASEIVKYSSTRPFYNDLEKYLNTFNFPFYLPEMKTFSTDAYEIYVGDLFFMIGEHPLYICYMLNANTKEPRIGDYFNIRLMLHYEKLTKADKNLKAETIKEFTSFFSMPDNRAESKHWARWINIWTSEPYQLKDMGKKDIQGLANILKSAIDETYDYLVTRLTEFERKNNKLIPAELPSIEFKNMSIEFYDEEKNSYAVKARLKLGDSTEDCKLQYKWDGKYVYYSYKEDNRCQQFFDSMKANKHINKLAVDYFQSKFARMLSVAVKNYRKKKYIF